MSRYSRNEQALRDAMIAVGERLWQRGLVAAHDGNISARLDNDRLLCTPSGFSKGFLGCEDLVVTDVSGQKNYGNHPASSELKMHVAIYANRPDVNVVIHAHPPHATAFAVAGLEVPERVLPEIDVLLARVAMVPYRQPGTQELADAVGDAARDSNVILMRNHGATVCGETLEQAWFRMESLEHCCRILLLAKQAGGWEEFSG